MRVKYERVGLLIRSRRSCRPSGRLRTRSEVRLVLDIENHLSLWWQSIPRDKALTTALAKRYAPAKVSISPRKAHQTTYSSCERFIWPRRERQAYGCCQSNLKIDVRCWSTSEADGSATRSLAVRSSRPHWPAPRHAVLLVCICQKQPTGEGARPDGLVKDGSHGEKDMSSIVEQPGEICLWVCSPVLS
jgi:hypothetical protein